MSSTRFSADYTKRPCGCKKCKQPLEKGCFRLAKIVPNPFTDKADDMKQYYHPECLFDTFKNARSTTRIIEGVDDVENYADLSEDDKDALLQLISNAEKAKSTTPSKKAKPLSPAKRKMDVNYCAKDDPASLKKQIKLDKSIRPVEKKDETLEFDVDKESKESEIKEAPNADDSLSEFNKLCDRISDVGSYLQKTQIVKDYITDGATWDKYRGDLFTLLKLLLPGVVKRVYNVNSKQLIKLFAQIFETDSDEMLEHLNSQGDISETISHYFENSSTVVPRKTSSLTLREVDEWLDEMTQYTREDGQQRCLLRITKKCTSRDLKSIIRLLKHDLRINAGAKHILNAVDSNAYAAFQSSRDLKFVVNRVKGHVAEVAGSSKSLHAAIHLGIPCLPMLAEVCRSTEYAMKKCPQGMYAEIKYDGERVQIHKDGHKFHFFSRSLKPVQRHKIEFLEDYISRAFPGGESLIIDSEVLLIDHKTGKPLPFGSLGIHKKTAFKNANVCLFVFDCLLYQNESLMDKSLKERKKFLDENMKPIKNYIMFSEMQFIKHGDNHKLNEMVQRAINEGLEGLMIKDVTSLYEPGKRHWLKIKKDYLLEGSMADAADLIVLGAYYGTGNKGGLLSVFLMGCYDPETNKFRTVTKCGNGHDDETLFRINKQLTHKVVKISRNFDQLPEWLLCNRQLVPDFVVRNPKQDAPVWEISGAEFTSSDAHTASGISIRFPRVTKIRDDKTWKTATNLQELKNLYAKSKEKVEFTDRSKSEPDSEPAACQRESPSSSKLKYVEEEKKQLCSVISSPTKKPRMSKTLFESKVFYLSDNLSDKNQISRQIMYHGGDITDNVGDATHFLTNEKKKQFENKHTTVVSVDWIKRCVKENQLLPV